MTDDIARIVADSRAAQGLPAHIEDPAILARIAALAKAGIACVGCVPPCLECRGARHA